MASDNSTTTTAPPVPSTIPAAPGSGGAPSQDFSAYYQKAFDRAWNYLKQLPLKQRLDTLEMLRKKGFSSGTAVSPTGLDASDIARVREVLVYQDTLANNVSDTVLPQTMTQIKTLADQATSGGSKATPAADLDAYLTSVMQARLGRSPRADEMDKFRKAYAAMEAGGNEPTATVAAQEQIKTQNPAEYEASQFASFASTFENMLRGA